MEAANMLKIDEGGCDDIESKTLLNFDTSGPKLVDDSESHELESVHDNMNSETKPSSSSDAAHHSILSDTEIRHNKAACTNTKRIKHTDPSDPPCSRKKMKKEKKKEVDENKNNDIHLYDETDYYFENGLRKVYPYIFHFVSYCKGRWIGRKLLDVFSTEFRAYPEEEYKTKIEQGVLTVNGRVVKCDYELKNGDKIENKVHRHETPVIEQKSLKIIHMADDLLAVDKPCSWPVHPCGRYRYNSVVFVLAKEYNLKNLKTIHRLDRLTSGVLMFGRTAERTQVLMQQIRDREISKDYLCRVEGNFPDETIHCTESIKIISYKLGMCKVAPDGKECETDFQKLSYNGKTSLVLCKPKTGRMHQIRVHLQYLGHPISNDPLYNSEIFGKDKGKLGNYYKTNDELIQGYVDTYNAENWLGVQACCNDSSAKVGAEKVTVEMSDLSKEDSTSPVIQSSDSTNESRITGKFDSSRMVRDANCYECKVNFRDPLKKDLVMYLHALRYKGPGWMYETSYPYWAEDGFVED